MGRRGQGSLPTVDGETGEVLGPGAWLIAGQGGKPRFPNAEPSIRSVPLPGPGSPQVGRGWAEELVTGLFLISNGLWLCLEIKATLRMELCLHWVLAKCAVCSGGGGEGDTPPEHFSKTGNEVCFL